MAQVATTFMAPNNDGRLEFWFLVIASEGYTTPPGLWRQYQTTPNGAWFGWISIGLPLNVTFHTSPTVVANPTDGHLEVFTSDNENLWHIYQQSPGDENSWSDWQNLGHPGTTAVPNPVRVGANQNGALELYTIGVQDQALWHQWQKIPGDSETWSGWSSLSTAPEYEEPSGTLVGYFPTMGAPPEGFQDSGNAAVANYPWAYGGQVVVVWGNDGNMWSVAQYAPNNGWLDWHNLGSPQG